jgi:hypothetical protein
VILRAHQQGRTLNGLGARVAVARRGAAVACWELAHSPPLPPAPLYHYSSLWTVVQRLKKSIALLHPFPPQIKAYLEVHIEQGPVLQAAGRRLGTVAAIAGQSRLQAEIWGEQVRPALLGHCRSRLLCAQV